MQKLKIEKNLTLNLEQPDQFEIEVGDNTEASLIINLVNKEEGLFDLAYNIGSFCNFKTVIINHCETKLQLKERYDINEASQVTVAYCQLQKQECEVNTEYHLQQRQASILVQGAILATENKDFNLDCFHHAPDTTANINNYGVVLGTGRCNVIVRNKIEKGMVRSETHQATRLLTYGKKAIGKILPVLYIDENDVAASHAASLGQPDDAQLFYMMTRGLSKNEALELLTIGYLQPVAQLIEDEEIKKLLENEIQQKVDECLMSN